MVKLFNLSYYLVDGVARLILIGHGWYFVITFRVFFGGTELKGTFQSTTEFAAQKL